MPVDGAQSPQQSYLDAVWARTARATILDGGVDAGQPLGSHVLLEVTDDDELRSLQSLLEIDEQDLGGHCLCEGDLALVLTSSNDADLLVVGIHHGEAVRVDDWSCDGELLRGRELKAWLSDRGVVIW